MSSSYGSLSRPVTPAWPEPPQAGEPSGPAGPGPDGPGGYGYGPGGYGYGPGGYGGPGGPGGGRGRVGRPGPRRRFRLLAAGAAVIVAAGAFFGTRAVVEAATGGTVPRAALTTAQIAARTDPGLVDVVSALGLQQGESAGTGLVLTPSGEILTNNHVIEGATSIRVTDIGNGRSYPARVVGYDRAKDIAVLQLSGASGLQTVSLGNSAAATVGQKVVALGNAGGRGGTPSVAKGMITGLDASIVAADQSAGTSEHLTGLIHHDANIQPGDSGGPLVNAAGQVIGIDTAASARFQLESGQAGRRPVTQAFAIPINEAVAIARQIEAGASSATVHIGPTGLLGVEVTPAGAGGFGSGGIPGFGQSGSGQPAGADVAGVLPGGPAAQAGLAAGDVITAVNGSRVASPDALQTALGRHHPGDSVQISWATPAGQPQTATVRLVTGPAA